MSTSSNGRELNTHEVQMAPEKASAQQVFTEFSNGGAWPTDGLSFFIGLIGSVFAMFGKPLSASNKPRKHRLTAVKDVMPRFM